MKRFGLWAMLAAALVSIPQSARAEEPIPTELAASEAEEFMGLWKLTTEVMGNTLEMFLRVVEVEGQTGATLDSTRSPEPLAISSIQKIDGRLDLNSELKFGGSFTIDINLNFGIENGNLVGTVEDAGGLIKSEILGVPFSDEELGDVQGERPDPTETRINIGGKRVRIAFADLEMGSADWERFQNVGNDEVFTFTLSRATKLYTDFDLDFDGTIVKKENVAEDYPGVYSLWLKQYRHGWRLVFNEQPDIWGTLYKPEHDAAEVPLTVKVLDEEPVEKFVAELEMTGDNTAKLVMRWGTTEWSTDMTLVVEE